MKSAAALLVVLALWTVGLLAFASRVAHSTPAADPPISDGIVALTGASTARLTGAVHLLEIGRAQRLLISGVNRATSRADIEGVTKATRRYYDCCVDLGFRATDTVGNARETAAWAHAHGYGSVIVVTSDFHIPRAMLELGAAMPSVRLTPYPVRSADLDAAHWWRTPGGARRMVTEYCKYLAILVRELVFTAGGGHAHLNPAAEAHG
jgi:uncharacterized SAM-binding protein YcdF (DUF218 family)